MMYYSTIKCIFSYIIYLYKTHFHISFPIFNSQRIIFYISPNFIGDSEIDNLAETSLSIANSNKETKYIDFCRANNLQPHPARIQHGTIEYFVRFLTDEEDIVFDPFGGSNSLGMVSEKLKRNWISSELNIDYIKGSIIRFHNETEATDHIKRMAEKG